MEFSNVFDFLLTPGHIDEYVNSIGLHWPHIDLVKTDAGLELFADLPGFSKDDIKINIKNNILTLSGERQRGTKPTDSTIYHAERSFCKIKRMIKLPLVPDQSTIVAKYDNGVLHVLMPLPVDHIENAIQIL